MVWDAQTRAPMSRLFASLHAPLRTLRRGGRSLGLFLPLFSLFLGGALRCQAANAPWNYAVQVSATVDPDRPRITLRWAPPDASAGTQAGRSPYHVVYRKRVSDLESPDWGGGTTVAAGQNSFTDDVEAGVAYEYRITRIYDGLAAQYNGVGYIRSGWRVPLIEDRGTVLVVPESGVAGALGAEIAQWMEDLQGDGWRTVRIDGFSSASHPNDLRARLRQEYGAGGNVQAVLLLGRLPIPFSGEATNPDGHGIRPMPADGFYGDMSGDWGAARREGNRWIFSRNTYPGRIALQVGRVDFAEMPGVQAVSPHASEVALLRNYFAKARAYRLAQRVPERRALVGDAFGDYYFEGVVEPFAAVGYRNFAPLVGYDRTVVYDDFHGSRNTAGWFNAVTSGTYLWAFAGGAGGDSGDGMASVGPGGGELRSRDLVSGNARAQFYLFFGSYMVDWTRPNNLVRAALAPADYGLAAAWAGRPFLYFHAMGLGETLGYGMRASQNLSGTVYDTPVKIRPSGNTYPQGVYLALHGDPTLRMDPVPPVTGFAHDSTTGAATWLAPAGVAVQEYRVYWLNSGTGRFERMATLPADARAYAPNRSGRFMLRAVALQTGSGTYYNASQGVFWNATAANPDPQPDPQPGSVRLAVPVQFRQPPVKHGPMPKP